MHSWTNSDDSQMYYLYNKNVVLELSKVIHLIKKIHEILIIFK